MLEHKARESWVTMGELNPVAAAEAAWDESRRLASHPVSLASAPVEGSSPGP